MDLIYSPDYYLLLEAQKQKIKELQLDSETIETFSFIDNSLAEIIDSLLTLPMFSKQKIIIIHDSWFLTNKKIALHPTFNFDSLLTLLNRGLPDANKVIFTLNHETLAKNKKSQNFIRQVKVNKIDSPTLSFCQTKVKEWLEESKINFSADAWKYFWTIMPLDLSYLEKEIGKLVNLEAPEITLEMTKQISFPWLENDIFKLSEAFLRNDCSNFLTLYKDYCLQNNELIPLLALLGNHLITLRNYLVLKEKGLYHQEIIQKLGVNPYYLNNILRINNETIAQLNGKIDMIYELNRELICGAIDTRVIPEYKFIKAFEKSKRKDKNNGAK
ncbi:DNA polymerase III delta subunit [Entomoplasma freundtii]|uniref:DNA polymerase III subunit delta n=1 Tax=Entomoplasma freundtii TaxID=74700 RepID=A0A2K8NUB6_9MOLU|nr:hypothetical protein [Entomoplasma freundtii]ATZ16361.1 DNA polymerase III subunit delta [Entomoplasma freundtii]TDY56600.1 DNA polymerase III delta subunit [Entomoplasma freundtii]